MAVGRGHLAVALVVLLAACTGAGARAASDGRSASGGALTVRATEFAYEPSELRVAGPGPFTVTLENRGALEHDFAIEGVSGPKLLAMPGRRAAATFTVAGPGVFAFVCTLPGHKEAGQRGTLVVG